MKYNPDGESREVESEQNNYRRVKKSKMSRKSLHTIFWIALGIGAIFTYIVMLFMGNPFSTVAGKFITGGALAWVISTIILWWTNSTTLFFAKKWYMSKYWYLKQWLADIISAGIVVALYFINLWCGLWILYIIGVLSALGLLLFIRYYTLSKVIDSINKNTINDDPIEEYEEQ